MLPEPKVSVALAAGPRAVVLPACNVPALMVVPPVYVFAPESTQVPAPDLMSEVAPPVPSPMMGANALLPVLLPVRVRVRAPLPPNAIEPVLVKLIVFAAVALLLFSAAVSPAVSPIVNRRLVLVAPVVPEY